jgi:hypothetical protein
MVPNMEFDKSIMEISFEDFDELYEEESEILKNGDTSQKNAKHNIPIITTKEEKQTETFYNRKIKDYSDIEYLFLDVRNKLSKHTCLAQKVTISGKRKAEFKKRVFFIINGQLIFIHDIEPVYCIELTTNINLIHFYCEDRTETVVPEHDFLSILKFA